MLRIQWILFLLPLGLFSFESMELTQRNRLVKERGNVSAKQKKSMDDNISINNFIMSGYIKMGYQYSKYQKNTKNIQSALGGALHIHKKWAEHIDFNVTIFTTQSIFRNNNIENVDISFFNSEGEGYFLLGEIYTNIQMNNINFKIGRQLVETPFIQEYDVAMIPNTFEGLSVSSEILENTTLEGFWLYKMAGGIYTDIPESFTTINEDNGVFAFGLLYDTLENFTTQAWFYMLSSKTQYTYLESTYKWNKNNILFNTAFQYSYQTHEEQKNSSMVGIEASISIQDSQWTLSSAINNVLRGTMSNGIGNGPFFVNNAYLGLSDVGERETVVNYSIGYQPSAFSDNLFINYIHSHLSLKDNNSIYVDDFELDYVCQNNATFTFSASHIRSYNKEDNYNIVQTFYIYPF